MRSAVAQTDALLACYDRKACVQVCGASELPSRKGSLDFAFAMLEHRPQHFIPPAPFRPRIIFWPASSPNNRNVQKGI